MMSVLKKICGSKNSLKSFDNEVYQFIEKELQHQKSQLQLIASENFASKAVMEAQGSFLNKYE